LLVRRILYLGRPQGIHGQVDGGNRRFELMGHIVEIIIGGGGQLLQLGQCGIGKVERIQDDEGKAQRGGYHTDRALYDIGVPEINVQDQLYAVVIVERIIIGVVRLLGIEPEGIGQEKAVLDDGVFKIQLDAVIGQVSFDNGLYIFLGDAGQLVQEYILDGAVLIIDGGRIVPVIDGGTL